MPASATECNDVYCAYSGMMIVRAAPTRRPIPVTDMALRVLPLSVGERRTGGFWRVLT